MTELNWLAVLFMLVLGAAIAFVNRRWAVLGGYDDRAGVRSEQRRPILAKASFPKAWVHLVETALLALMGWTWTLPILLAILVAELIMLGYEWSQKLIDRYDLAANLAGGIAAYLIYLIRGWFV